MPPVGKRRRRAFDETTMSEILEASRPVLVPFREYLSEYLAWMEEEKQKEAPSVGYGRRPLIGLKLELPDDKALAIRPRWHPPGSVKLEPGVYAPVPGRIDPKVITLELVGPGKLLALTLDGTEVKRGRAYYDMDINRKFVKAITDAARSLLLDPMATFSTQSEYCCKCGKPLTDLTSRTRGIGPECIRYFRWFAEVPPPKSVERFRLLAAAEYLADTGFLPGR
jgi:hypothetical protein